VPTLTICAPKAQFAEQDLPIDLILAKQPNPFVATVRLRIDSGAPPPAAALPGK
jgi:hypothetical protein